MSAKKAAELRVCRGCLAKDLRLCDMRQNRLMEAYNTLLSNALQVTDNLPHYMCSYCAALLLKCDSFRIKCVDALILFRNAQLHKSEINMNGIPNPLVQSCIETIDFIDASDSLETIPESKQVEYNKDVKVEMDENIKLESLNLKAQTKIDSHYAVTTYSNKKMKVEVSSVELDTSDLKSKKDDSDFELSYDSNDLTTLDSDSENDDANFEMKNEPIKSKRKTKLKVTRTTDAKNAKQIQKTKKKKVKIKSYNKKSKFDENMSETYNIEVEVLRIDQQLKEIADRKESDNYKLANFRCNICYKGFIIEDTYNKHMLIHDDISGKYVCDICQYHFMSKLKLGIHKGNHKKRFTCKDCGLVTKYLHKVKEHHKWHNGTKYKCKHCEQEFKSTSRLYGHLKMNHPVCVELVRCEICGDAFNGPSGLNFHERKSHKEMFSPECYCSGCKRQFYSSDAFKTHQGSDGACDPRAKCCVRCGMAFETQELLEEHEIEQRKPRTSFKCEVCSKTFQGVTSYKKHLRTHSSSLIHTRNVNKAKKRAICEICGKVLANKNLLKQHHGNKHSTATPYQCTVCPKSFRSPLNLQLHTRTHTGERPYRCPHCSKAFKTYTNMKRHKLVHSGERPHTCEMCGKAFKTKCDAKTHVKTVHMKVPMPPRIRRRTKKTEC